jgi:hypothetical protein
MCNLRINKLDIYNIPRQRSCFIITFIILVLFSTLFASTSTFCISLDVHAQKNNNTTATSPSQNTTATSPSQNTTATSPSQNTTATSLPSISFKAYDNPILGLKIQYPSNWEVRQHPYSATGNSTIVSFFSPPTSQTAASYTAGQADTFVPYIDIFVFNSKKMMSIDQLVNGSIKHSLSNATVSHSKPITLTGNISAHAIEYSVMIANKYLFDRNQVWAKSGNKVFVISYTSEPQTYLTYLPTMLKMIQSLRIANSPSLKSDFNNRLPNAPSSAGHT